MAARADPDDRDGDDISGRLPSGRFGWKARTPDLTRAVAAAFAVELGLSSEHFPQPDVSGTSADRELTTAQITAVVDYIRSRPAPVSPENAADLPGSAVFTRIGCAACHRPFFVLRDERRTRLVSAYTDLLLHDMGPALADGIAEGNATEREFRTPPLWGLRHRLDATSTTAAPAPLRTPSAPTAARQAPARERSIASHPPSAGS